MADGITTADGDSLRISGIKIDLTSGTVSHAGISMTTEAWLPWLAIASDELRSAKVTRQSLVEAAQRQDFNAKLEALETEMKASMVAISASSFALDAFYARVKELAPPPQELVTAWRKNKTARHRQVTELQLRNFAYKPGAPDELRQNTESLYKLRDWLVHPPADFKPVQLHPVLKEAFEWRKTVFTFENAQQSHNFALAVIKVSVESSKPKEKALREWCINAQKLLEPLLKVSDEDK